VRALYREFAAQEEIDAAYDVEKSVADFPAYARRYVDESKLARHRLDCRPDIRYGPTRDEHLDIFPAAARAPVFVFFHGGYWRMLSSKDVAFVALGPAKAGIVTVNVNYSLCPKVTIDEIVRQARAAIAWTWHNIAGFGGDRDRIYLGGHSAGAHLVAMALAADWSGEYGLAPGVVKGALCLSGLYDLRPLRYSFVQSALQLTADAALRNSPLLNPPRGVAARVLVSWGESEPAEFRRQSQDFLGEWQCSGNLGSALPQPGADHFSTILGLAESDSPLCRHLFRAMGTGTPALSRTRVGASPSTRLR
jgi:arylformamidase